MALSSARRRASIAGSAPANGSHSCSLQTRAAGSALSALAFRIRSTVSYLYALVGSSRKRCYQSPATSSITEPQRDLTIIVHVSWHLVSTGAHTSETRCTRSAQPGIPRTSDTADRKFVSWHSVPVVPQHGQYGAMLELAATIHAAMKATRDRWSETVLQDEAGSEREAEI